MPVGPECEPGDGAWTPDGPLWRDAPRQGCPGHFQRAENQRARPRGLAHRVPLVTQSLRGWCSPVRRLRAMAHAIVPPDLLWSAARVYPIRRCHLEVRSPDAPRLNGAGSAVFMGGMNRAGMGKLVGWKSPKRVYDGRSGFLGWLLCMFLIDWSGTIHAQAEPCGLCAALYTG